VVGFPVLSAWGSTAATAGGSSNNTDAALALAGVDRCHSPPQFTQIVSFGSVIPGNGSFVGSVQLLGPYKCSYVHDPGGNTSRGGSSLDSIGCSPPCGSRRYRNHCAPGCVSNGETRNRTHTVSPISVAIIIDLSPVARRGRSPCADLGTLSTRDKSSCSCWHPTASQRVWKASCDPLPLRGPPRALTDPTPRRARFHSSSADTLPEIPFALDPVVQTAPALFPP
jgi:hypothetical protein